jgi:deoxyadenosine/deoxycytidine kinase
MIISVDGNISSGKSTIVRNLRGAGRTVYPEPIESWTFLDKFYEDKRTYALPLALQVLASFADYEFPATDAANADVVITERSPLTNREVFTKMHANDGTMRDDEWELYKKYFDVLGWTPDAIVYIQTPVEICHRRMLGRARMSETDVDFEYLERLEKSYDTLLRFVKVPVVFVDGTGEPDAVLRDVELAIRKLTSGRVS